MHDTVPPPLQARLQEFIDLRRDLHMHPELGLAEQRTAALVANCLDRWGYEVTRGVATTGVVAQLRRGSASRRLGLRADMDALPIQECTGLPYASRTPGVMHACGHDGHTAMLLAAAWYLAEHGRFDGCLNLIFQPAEEHPGGARLMLQDGLFNRFPCDAVFAMHNMPGIPSGTLVFFDGAVTASSDDVTVTIQGTDGHGAMPHLAADPVVAASSIVVALQSIVARNVDPLQSAVITVGSLHAGSVNNVIPKQAQLCLSVRALSPEVRDLLERRIRALVQAQAHSFGVLAEIDYRRDYPVLVNTPIETALAREVALAHFGVDQVRAQGQVVMGSEDFAFLLEHCPGSYLLIGNGDGPGNCMVHHNGYDFDDSILGIGAAYWVRLAERFLAS